MHDKCGMLAHLQDATMMDLIPLHQLGRCHPPELALMDAAIPRRLALFIQPRPEVLDIPIWIEASG